MRVARPRTGAGAGGYGSLLRSPHLAFVQRQSLAQSRKVLFYGYSYRWLRPRDEVTLDERLSDRMDPVRAQLFGASPTGNYGYTSPNAVDVPLRAWIESHAGAEAVAV